MVGHHELRLTSERKRKTPATDAIWLFPSKNLKICMFSMVVIVLAASAVLACQPGVGYAYCPTCFRFARKADQADQIGYGSVAGGKLPHEIKAYSIQMKTMSKS
ncbi:hypothetical protein Q1695_003661 [Nippostrongylus brasiliensis]|nr:hypothetical protein Q1695_003661 [Nippostrongylus brasiliensis]